MPSLWLVVTRLTLSPVQYPLRERLHQTDWPLGRYRDASSCNSCHASAALAEVPSVCGQFLDPWAFLNDTKIETSK